MKKLMVALTAVALGACAWAEEAVTPTLTEKVEFKNVTAGQWTPETGWSYTGDADALNIVGDAGSRVLEIKTGTTPLTRNVWSDGNAGVIGDGIYIDTTINFQNQALDEVPVATNDEKLAIFVLDTTEIEGAPAGTNVYVLAGYGESGKALYRLAGFDDKIISGGAYRVVVKSYANVIAGGNRTGFLVYISNGAEATFAPCKVDSDGVFKLNADGSVNWTSVATQTDYLGLTDTFKTTAAVARWVNPAGDSACLFLSLPTSNLKQGKLSAVDFVGNAQIASVEVTATNPGFPADLFTMTLETNGVTVALVSGAGVTLADGALTATADGVTVEVSVTLDEGMNMLTASANATKLDNGNWSFTFDNGGTVSFTGSKAAAYVGEKAYANIADAVNVFRGTAGATLRLAQTTIWPTENADLVAENLTLDLAGQTLTLAEGTVLTVASGSLTITDSSEAGNGKIAGAGEVGNMGALVIEKGIFDVAVVNYNQIVPTAEVTVNGGSFLKTYNSTDDGSAFKLAVPDGLEVVTDGNYWKVQTKAAAQVSLTIVNETGATISGVVAGTVAEGSNITFTVAAAAGYKNVQVTVDGATATVDAGTYSFTVGKENITITVKATAIKYATLTITPVDNCTITVKNGEAVVESGAKFDVEDNVSLTVTRTPDPGYELDGCAATETITMTADQTVTAAVKAVTPTVTPDAPATNIKAGSVQAAADQVELKATSPNAEIVTDTAYTAYFTKQVTATGEGVYTVTAVLKDEIVQAAVETAAVAAKLGTVAAAATDTAVNVTGAKAGLYYSVKYTGDVANIATAAEGARVMAGADGKVTITLPKVAGGKAFYQVQVNTAPKAQ